MCLSLLPLIACSEHTATEPEVKPAGTMPTQRSVMLDPLNVNASGCTDYLGFWHQDLNACTTGTSTPTNPPTDGTPTSGGGGGGDPAPLPPADSTADNGPAAFLVCVASRLGVDGWSALAGTGLTAYSLYDQRKAVAQTAFEYNAYDSKRDLDPNWDADILNLYRARYNDARATEQKLWLAFDAALAYAVGKTGVAAATCLPVAALPEP
jgi:hypothetical protein